MCCLLATVLFYLGSSHLIFPGVLHGTVSIPPVSIPVSQMREPRHTQRQVCRGKKQDLSSHHHLSACNHCGVLSAHQLCPREYHSRMEKATVECVSWPVREQHTEIMGKEQESYSPWCWPPWTKSQEDGNRAWYQLLPRHCRPRGTPWWCILDLFLFSSKPLFCQTFAALPVQWLVWDHTEHHKDSEVPGMRKCVSQTGL